MFMLRRASLLQTNIHKFRKINLFFKNISYLVSYLFLNATFFFYFVVIACDLLTFKVNRE